MAKNYMAEVAKMLGLELKEEFSIDAYENERFKLTNNGLYHCEDKYGWRDISDILTNILRGRLEIKKLPWKPKEHEDYYYVSWFNVGGEWVICAMKEEYYLSANDVDNLRNSIGNCFKTETEAEAQKYEVFKRLTGKDWRETYGKDGDDNG